MHEVRLEVVEHRTKGPLLVDDLRQHAPPTGGRWDPPEEGVPPNPLAIAVGVNLWSAAALQPTEVTDRRAGEASQRTAAARLDGNLYDLDLVQ
jgi:hypothetical protein